MSGWNKKKYRILLSNGDERWTEGKSNGLFAFDPGFTLTHLGSGGKIARFTSEDAAKRAGDYLKDKYREEFTVLSDAITKNLNAEQYKKLPETVGLNEILIADVYFNTQLAVFAVKDKLN
jgi:hypothetical protein